VQRRQKATGQNQRRKSKKSRSMIVPSLKASMVGGFGILVLMLIGLIPPPENLPFISLAFLVVPGFLVVCLSTGLLAGIFAGDSIESTFQGGQAGWMAGFWAGIYGGIIAMLLAAVGISVFGIPIVNFGYGIVSQFTPEQLEGLTNYGLTPDTIALMGRVFGTLIIVGLVGSLISALFSAIGGMIYPKLGLQR
jgi:hypothetical protein